MENYSLRSHFVNVLVNNYVAACLRLEKKSNLMNVQVDIDAGRTFRLQADVNVECTSLILTPDVRSDPMSTTERLPTCMDVRSALMSTSHRDVRPPEPDTRRTF